nr:unnamed protein product [Callosobruchus analis]
MKFRSILRT